MESAPANPAAAPGGEGLEPMSPRDAAAEIHKRKAELAAEAKPRRSIPKKIGDYDVLAEINRGGMGLVYKAIDPQLRRQVAIKVLLAGEGATDEDIKRFQREAQANARLQHPHIVQIYAVGQHEGKPYLVMDFIEGKTAKQLKEEGKMTPRLAISIIEDCAEALHHAHQNGVIHRDVKPGNIIVNLKEQAQLMDFGLARRVDEDLEVTQSGTTMGTPSYMAPEQAEGNLTEVDAQSDVYSAGACLYELLTGRPPFEATTVMATLKKVLEDTPVPPRRLNPKIHRDVETICLKCLEKDKHNRYGSARQLAEDIRRFNAGEAILAKPLGRMASMWRRAWRHKEISLAALIMVISGFTALGYSVQQSRAMTQLQKQERENALAAALTSGRNALAKVVDAIAGLSDETRGDFQHNAAHARTVLAEASTVVRQAEGLAPDNPEVRQSLEKLKTLENELEVRRFIFKARTFLYPAQGRPEDPPVLSNYAGAEFAAQEAVDRDPDNAEARQLLKIAQGIRAVSIETNAAGVEVSARRVLDQFGRQLPNGEAGINGKPLGRTPISRKELEPGLYIFTFRDGLAGLQQATMAVGRESREEDLLLRLNITDRRENMVLIPEGSVTLPQIGERKLPEFSIDRFEYPNRAGSTPTTGVTLMEAQNLCRQQNKQLCSSAQWLRACMGDEERRYPYGKSYSSRTCAAGMDADAQQRPLFSGMFPRCRTAEGVFDMSGNVSEWTESDQEDSIFGGDWTSPARFADLTVSCIARSIPDQVSKERLGFRCCKDK